jgi:glycosyltransferase involved in cell wall biosynthesis
LGARDYSYRVLADYLEERLHREPDVDVLHAQHLHSGPPAIRVGCAHGRATVLTLRDYWPVCLHGTSWWGAAACDGCSTATLTGCMQEYWKWPRPIARAMVGWARRRLDARKAGVRAAHSVLAVSHTVKQRVERDLPGAALSVVPNMVDPVLLEATAASVPGAGVESPYVLTAGKLQPTKGFDLLLRALGEMGSTMPLLVAGDGPMRRALEEQARALRLPVRFLGWVSHDQLLRLQQQAHAVVLPSAWDEPLSRIVLETMALGVPVVAWARGGNPEMIEPGVSGWLVSRTGDLAHAMAELASPDRRREVALGARRRVASRYTPDVVYPAVAAAYEAAIEKAGRR